MKFSSPIFCFLIASAFCCTKPRSAHDIAMAEHRNTAVTFTTSLADTIPAKSLNQLHIGNVLGIKYRDLDGTEVRYFNYVVSKTDLLRMVAQLPFSVSDSKSDSLCRKVPPENLEQYKASPGEMQAVPEFWTSKNNSDIYECIKGSQRHTLIFDDRSNRVYHRVEFLRG